MMFDFIVIFLVGMLLLFAAYTAFKLVGRFPKRTPEDVTPFLRSANSQEFMALLDPALEVNFRLRMAPTEFKDWQHRRIHLLREYLLRMSHNAIILIEWGNLEAFHEEGNPRGIDGIERRQLAQELVQAATEFRLYSILALIRLKLLLALPRPLQLLAPSPSLPSLRRILGIDAMDTYQRLKNAAGGLSQAYNHDFHSDLLARL